MKPERVPHTGVYIFLGLWTGCVAASGYVWSAEVACRIVSASMVAFGCGRAVLPGGVVPRVRSRLFDVATYALLAGALWYLANWAHTPTVASGRSPSGALAGRGKGRRAPGPQFLARERSAWRGSILGWRVTSLWMPHRLRKKGSPI